jgi:hypothetical protein
MRTPTHLRRAGIALAGAALLLAGAAGANAAGGPQPGTGAHRPALAASALASPLMAPGSDLQFVAVAPCRILDTRKAGGALHGTRTFTASAASYASQGGKAATCNIPDIALAVQLNLGAISQGNTSDVKGWAAGEAQPLASMVNYNPSGPVANMVTMPVDPLGRFNLQTPGTAHVFADVAGYYVQPLYASIDGTDGVNASVWQDIQAGLVSAVRTGTGEYELTFNRNVTACVALATDYQFATVHEISTDSDFSQDSTVFVNVKDSSTGDPEDTIFHIALTC